jgi:chromosome segregation ATPase
MNKQELLEHYKAIDTTLRKITEHLNAIDAELDAIAEQLTEAQDRLAEMDDD